MWWKVARLEFREKSLKRRHSNQDLKCEETAKGRCEEGRSRQKELPSRACEVKQAQILTLNIMKEKGRGTEGVGRSQIP